MLSAPPSVKGAPLLSIEGRGGPIALLQKAASNPRLKSLRRTSRVATSGQEATAQWKSPLSEFRFR